MAAQNKAAVVVAVVAAPVPAEDGGQSSEAGSAVDSAEELDDVRRAVRCLPLLSFSFLLPFLIFKYISIRVYLFFKACCRKVLSTPYFFRQVICSYNTYVAVSLFTPSRRASLCNARFIIQCSRRLLGPLPVSMKWHTRIPAMAAA